MAAAPESVKAEYAKSNRSSCRACSKLIENKSLTLGLVSKDKGRGFDDVKWHHLTCFPLPSPFPPHAVAGFSSLESSDQEALKELFASGDNSEKKVSETAEDLHNEQKETEENDSKKRKVVATEAPESVKAEYAKSNHSLCRACSKLIENKSLRLGLVSKDKGRGFEDVKWHHLSCFPLPSPVPPHAVAGFSSLESSDQEALKELFASHDNSEKTVRTQLCDISSGSKRSHESDAGDSNSIGSIARPTGREAAKKMGKKKRREAALEVVDKEWVEYKQLKEKELRLLDKIALMQQEANQLMKDRTRTKKMKLYVKLSFEEHLDDCKKELLKQLSLELFGY